jgi:hypothetical protein
MQEIALREAEVAGRRVGVGRAVVVECLDYLRKSEWCKQAAARVERHLRLALSGDVTMTHLLRRHDGNGVLGRDGNVVRSGVLFTLHGPAKLHRLLVYQ